MSRLRKSFLLQTIVVKLQDIQLAMVVLRLYETEGDTATAQLKEMLCREVLGQSIADFEAGRGLPGEDASTYKEASRCNAFRK